MADRDEHQPDPRKRAAIEVVAGVLALGAGAATGPAAPITAVAAQPLVSAVLNHVVDRVSTKRIQRGAEVLEVGARINQIDPEEYALKSVSNDEVLELTSRVIQSAQDTALQSKRRALAAVLAAAVREPDTARVDLGRLLVRVIDGVDAPHIRFLAALAPAEPRPSSAGDSGKFGMKLADVVAHDPQLAPVDTSLLQATISLGLVDDATGGLTFLPSARSYALSPLGRRLLQTLSGDALTPATDLLAPLERDDSAD